MANYIYLFFFVWNIAMKMILSVYHYIVSISVAPYKKVLLAILILVQHVCVCQLEPDDLKVYEGKRLP